LARLLIVDDDIDILKVMAAILAQAGHRIEASASVADALRKLGLCPDDPDAEPPDLVVIDVMMPQSDGYSLCRSIRTAPRTRDFPILVVSALPELSRLFTVSVAVDGFLRKPFQPEALIASVEDILRRSGPAGDIGS